MTKVLRNIFYAIYGKFLIYSSRMLSIDKKKIQTQIDKMSESGIDCTRSRNLIVSMTSYPARIKDVHYAVYSLLSQTLKPDKVVLWLGSEKFPGKEKDLPETLLKLFDFGLSIEWCDDIGPYTKLIPALKSYPSAIIVTADDDIFYPGTWLQDLYSSYSKNRDLIHCHRAAKIEMDTDNTVLPYIKWRAGKAAEVSFNNFLCGVGGVLYPPDSFYKDIADEKLFLTLTPTGDDIWFWAMCVLKNKKIKVIENNITKLTYINYKKELGVSGAGETLHSINVGQNRNDLQIRNILNFYSELMSIIRN